MEHFEPLMIKWKAQFNFLFRDLLHKFLEDIKVKENKNVL